MKILYWAALFAVAAPAFAQTADPIDRRVGRLEGEMRAVQRKVFPGGDPKFFEPEIAPAVAPPAIVTGTPASQPLNDLSDRVGELERQLRTLTGQVEANQFQIKQLQDAQAKLRGDVEFRLAALEGGAKSSATVPAPVAAPPLKGAKADPVKPPKPDTAPAKPVSETAAWKAAYASVLAKDWDAAAPALTGFITDWPQSARIPQAQYFLGKASAAKGDNAGAARAFLDNYKTYPKNPHAPDSLIGLANALSGLKKPKDACRVLGELDSYDALTAVQKTDAKAARVKAKCEG